MPSFLIRFCENFSIYLKIELNAVLLTFWLLQVTNYYLQILYNLTGTQSSDHAFSLVFKCNDGRNREN